MVHTLAALRVTYPEREFILVIGADNWQRFPQWYRSDEILSRHRVIIYPRPGCDIDATTLPQGVVLATDAPLFDISSTQIRESLGRPDYDGQGLDPNVWEQITQFLAPS
jgi:nicotinate-nucleotide adenylyltransferase